MNLREPKTDQSKIIVITGSTRGIGYGLALAFLERGCAVIVGGRSTASTADAVKKLSAQYNPQQVFGHACDVSDPAQVKSLWQAAVTHFGRVDIWINNAGHSGEQGMIWERPAAEAGSVIATNLLGMVYAAQVVVPGMLAQGGGAIYNMEGMGSDGRKHAGLTLYGTSKYAVHYFTKSLALELKDTPILVGALSPGMVVTDLILDRYKDHPAEFERVKPVFNIISDRVENVAPWLVERVLDNQKSGARLVYTPTWKLMWRFASSPFIRRNVFDQEG